MKKNSFFLLIHLLYFIMLLVILTFSSLTAWGVLWFLVGIKLGLLKVYGGFIVVYLLYMFCKTANELRKNTLDLADAQVDASESANTNSVNIGNNNSNANIGNSINVKRIR